MGSTSCERQERDAHSEISMPDLAELIEEEFEPEPYADGYETEI